MAISKIEQAILDIIAAADKSRIDSADIASVPDSATVTNMGSSIVIPAGPVSRMVVIGNISIPTAFLSVDEDAVMSAGIPVFSKTSLPAFELPEGHNLNGISDTGPVTLAFQTFSKA